MKAKSLFLVSLLTLSIVGAVVSEIHVASSDGATVVYVDPPLNSAPSGTYFTVDIKVANVTNLNSWFFTLYSRGIILYTNKTMIKQGPFLSNNGAYLTFFTVNQEFAVWHVGCRLDVETQSVSGSGTLASVTFLVIQEGYTNIELLATSLLDPADPDPIEIPHTRRSSYFSNARDVSILGIVPYPTTVSVGEPVFINVTVMNRGNETETFDVTANFDNVTIGSQTVTSLTAGTVKTLTFTWNTTGVADGTYTISANASILEGEIDTDNNFLLAVDEVTLTLAPAAQFSFLPAYPLVDENVTFDATASFDPDGYIANFSWNFGDGSIDTMNKTIVYHAYTSAGYYTVNLTVMDNSNMTDSELQTVAVGKPNASFSFTPASPIANQTVTFNASLSTPRGGIIANYTWDFDDGNTTTVSEPIIVHVYESAGNYTVTLNVTDSEGMSDIAFKSIIVGAPAQVPPKAAFTFTPESPLIQETVTFNATESTPNGGNIVSYEWNFGDGNTTTVSEPTITHAYTDSGNYTVTLTVTDNDGLTDTETKSITVQEEEEAPLDIIPYLALAIVIIVIAAVVVYLMKVRKSS